MSATLQMIFRNAANSNTIVSVADPDPAITAMEVEAVMDSIINRNVFNTSGGDIASKVRAQVVSRTVDILGEY